MPNTHADPLLEGFSLLGLRAQGTNGQRDSRESQVGDKTARRRRLGVFSTPPEVLEVKPRFCNMVTCLESLIYVHTFFTCRAAMRKTGYTPTVLHNAQCRVESGSGKTRNGHNAEGYLMMRLGQNGVQSLEITFLSVSTAHIFCEMKFH